MPCLQCNYSFTSLLADDQGVKKQFFLIYKTLSLILDKQKYGFPVVETLPMLFDLSRTSNLVPQKCLGLQLPSASAKLTNVESFQTLESQTSERHQVASLLEFRDEIRRACLLLIAKLLNEHAVNINMQLMQCNMHVTLNGAWDITLLNVVWIFASENARGAVSVLDH